MKKTFLSLLLLFFISILFAHAETPDHFPEEKAAESAYHLMVGMFGYTEEEARALRYEALYNEKTIGTHVSVYPSFSSDQSFFLRYSDEGWLSESDIIVPDWYREPTRSASTDDAICAARHLMPGLYGFKILDQFRYEAVVDPEKQRIEVDAYPFPESDEHIVLIYSANGVLVSHTLPDILDLSGYDEKVFTTNKVFTEYTLEERAAYSEEYIPKVEAILRLNPDYHDIVHYTYTRSRYGVPTDEDLSKADALAIADQALHDILQPNQEWSRNYGSLSFFDVTDENRPLWKFLFLSDTRSQYDRYVVRVNARTGEVVTAFKATLQTPLWELY